MGNAVGKVFVGQVVNRLHKWNVLAFWVHPVMFSDVLSVVGRMKVFTVKLVSFGRFLPAARSATQV